jgi:hypothetical protein
MKKISLIALSIFLLLSIGNLKLNAEDVSSYIIMSDIAPYERYTKERDPDTLELKTIPGYWIYRNSGVLIGADHFMTDHMDVTYKAKYQSKILHMGMSVEVTQHAGGDSDRWLLHELDADFRNYYGNPGDGYTMQIINGNTIIVKQTGGGKYRWLSGNKVIQISYTDLQLAKPEPIEVVKAYLTKHPSSMAMITSADLRTSDNKTKWIKDEMDRRLWLCDKWNAQLQAGSVQQSDLINNLFENIIIFLNYCEKCYGVSAKADLLLFGTYKTNYDLASMQTKLTEYKTWWAKHKDKHISLR